VQGSEEGSMTISKEPLQNIPLKENVKEITSNNTKYEP
jgi:hypothetical protein